jgi:iron complex outermembrane receptor protein
VTPKFSMDLATFYNHYHGLRGEALNGSIFIEDTPAPRHIILPAQFTNFIRGATKGIEIASDWRPMNWWRLEGSYSYLHMNLTQPPDSVDTSTVPTTNGSSPQHQVVFQSVLDLPRRLEFTQAIRYVSALPAQAVAGYTTADSVLSWHAKESLELSAVGRNLLQPHHPEFGGDPGPLVGVKRSVFARITWSK